MSNRAAFLFYCLAIVAGLFFGFAFKALGVTKAKDATGVPACSLVLQSEDAAQQGAGYMPAMKERVGPGWIFAWAKSKSEISALAVMPMEAQLNVKPDSEVKWTRGGECLTDDGQTWQYFRGEYQPKGV